MRNWKKIAAVLFVCVCVCALLQTNAFAVEAQSVVSDAAAAAARILFPFIYIPFKIGDILLSIIKAPFALLFGWF